MAQRLWPLCLASLQTVTVRFVMREEAPGLLAAADGEEGRFRSRRGGLCSERLAAPQACLEMELVLANP